MKIEDIQRNFLIGSEIVITLISGKERTGTLTGISQSSIALLQPSHNNPTIIDATQIALVEESAGFPAPVNPESVNSQPTTVPNNTIANPQPTHFTPPVEPIQPSSPPPQPTAYPPEIMVEVIKVAARLQGAIKQAEQSKLEPHSPNFEVPEEIKSQPYSTRRNNIVNGWNRLKDRYTSATKNDPSRLNTIAHEYEGLAESYPEIAAAAFFNRGCLQYQTQQAKSALKTFEAAAIKYREPRLFYNWAALALKQNSPEAACHALEEFLKQSSPSRNPSCWYKFLELAITYGITNRLLHLLKHPKIKDNRSDCQLILESAIYILDSHRKTDEACRIVVLLQQSDLEFEQITYLLESAFETLEIEPTSSYKEQEQYLADTTKRIEEEEARNRAKKQIEYQMSNAANFAKAKNYSRAIAEINEALKLDPNNPQLKQRAEDYRELQREQSAPKGTDLYSQALRARRAGDLKRAIELLQQEMNRGNTSERVLNEFASVLHQDNQTSRAIEEVKRYIRRNGESTSILNSLAGFYQHAGFFKESVPVLNRLLVLNPAKESTILKQLAFSHFKAKDYDETEKVLSRWLQIAPQDETAKRWLDGLQQAKKQGYDVSSIDVLSKTFILKDSLIGIGATISPFLEFYLERCEYEGVYDKRIQSGDFSNEDLTKTRGLIESTGRNRPGLRGQYYLTAAKLSMKLKAENERQVRSYLENFAVDMGDASRLEGKKLDVALTYYSEAFAIATKWHTQLDESFSHSIQLFCSVHSEKPPKPIDVLVFALDCNRLPVLMNWLFEISFNESVAGFLLPEIYAHSSLCQDIQAQCYGILKEDGKTSTDFQDFVNLWGRTRDRLLQKSNEITREFSALRSLAENLGTVQEQSDKLQQLTHKFRDVQIVPNSLDSSRLNQISEILQRLFQYQQQQSYVEKESLSNKIKWEIGKQLEEIEKEPTKDSVELFYPYLERLKETLEKHFDEVQRAAEPSELQAGIVGDPYIPQLDSNISCKITIANQPGKSPVSEIVIWIEPSDSRDYSIENPEIRINQPLAGGEKNTCEVILTVAEKAKTSQVFTLYYRLEFKTRRDEKVSTDVQSLSVRVGREEDFEEIENPYRKWALSHAVKDPQMFYGRDEMLNNLVSAIGSSSETKSLVIYGQKRSGKSSILYHLEQRLTMPIIPISFSIGDIQGNLTTPDSQDEGLRGNESITAFLYRILYRIKSKFRDLEEEGYPELNIERPKFSEVQQSPQTYFFEYMDDLKRELKRHPVYKDAMLVLLIDEFTYIYSGIKRGHISPTFMSLLKAILQAGYFSSVLVGQDTMTQFLTSFPNELQIADKQRVSYLAPHDAERLMDEPLRLKIPGELKTESRYKAVAIPRLKELTANSPFYIQIFCDRLVDYMNLKKLARIADPDIDNVKDELIRGANSLDITAFDNLISSDINETNQISQDQTLIVLREIAIRTRRRQSWCDSSEIKAETTPSIDEILKDLVDREVIEKDGESLYRIRVELFKEWLLANQ